MPDADPKPEKKNRACNVCKTDADSLEANGRECDGCGAITCKHVASSKGNDDRCPLCALRARKAEKAKTAAGSKKPDDKKPDDAKGGAA